MQQCILRSISNGVNSRACNRATQTIFIAEMLLCKCDGFSRCFNHELFSLPNLNLVLSYIQRVHLNGSQLAKLEKSILSCYFYEIHKVEAVGLKHYNYTWITNFTIFVIIGNLGQFLEKSIFCQQPLNLKFESENSF